VRAPASSEIGLAAPAGTRRPLSNGLIGMLIFVVAEAMLFAGLISAFRIVRAAVPDWPPPGQPRLPAAETLANTALLLASGALLFQARQAYFRGRRDRARWPLLAALVLGGCFVIFQGREWLGLLSQGLTLTSSQLGSFFYLIVGLHGLHAVAALGLLGWAGLALWRGSLRPSLLHAAELLWYFVVCVWPFLYWQVYL